MAITQNYAFGVHRPDQHYSADIDLDSLPVETSPRQPYEALNSQPKDGPEPEFNRKELIIKQLKLMGPIVLTHALNYLPNLFGVLLVSHLNSPDTEVFVNAVTFSTLVVTLTSFSVGYGFCSALETLASQAYGGGQRKKIGVYLQTGIIVVFGGLLVPVFLLNWHVETILLAVGQDAHVAKLAGEFSRYTAWGTPFIFLHEMLVKLLEAQNVVHPVVCTSIVGNIVEIASGYYLCYHTSLGFHGAAVARVVGAIALLLLLAAYAIIGGSYKNWWAGWDFTAARVQVGVFVRLGVPGLVMVALEWWAYEIATAMAGLLPNAIVSVTAHVVLLNLVTFMYMAYDGVACSGRILVGNALGANQPKRAQFTSRVTMTIALVLASICAAFTLGLRFIIPRLLSDDPEVIRIASQGLLVVVPYCVIDSVYCSIQGIYCGMGRQTFAAATNAVAFYVIGLPVAAILAFHFHTGVVGMWIGLELGSFAALVVSAVVLHRTDWQEMASRAHTRLLAK